METQITNAIAISRIPRRLELVEEIIIEESDVTYFENCCIRNYNDFLFTSTFKKYIFNPAKKTGICKKMFFTKERFLKGMPNEDVLPYLKLAGRDSLLSENEVLSLVYYLVIKTEGKYINDDTNKTILGHYLCFDGIVRTIVTYFDIKYKIQFFCCYNQKKSLYLYSGDKILIKKPSK